VLKIGKERQIPQERKSTATLVFPSVNEKGIKSDKDDDGEANTESLNGLQPW
jgi:hypothetical protein